MTVYVRFDGTLPTESCMICIPVDIEKFVSCTFLMENLYHVFLMEIGSTSVCECNNTYMRLL